MAKENGAFPLVSVIIPMRNEEKRIAKCIESILGQDYPHEKMEVFIVDGASTDCSAQIVAEYTERHPFIRLVENPDKIVPCGLNKTIPMTRGRYIIRMDAHSEYAEDYIRLLVYYLEKTGAENVGGTLTTCPGADTLMARCIAAITSKSLVVGGAAFRVGTKTQYSDTCVFGAWPREVFEKVGLFNEALSGNQDNEFCSRIKHYGGKLLTTPAIRIRYYNRATWGALMGQAWRSGVWNVITLVANPWSFRFRYFVPFAFDLWLFGFGLLSFLHPYFLLPLLAAIVSYAVLVMVVALQVGFRDDWKLVPFALICVPSYQVCYGLGTFAGIVRFLIFGREQRKRARRGSRIPDPDHPPLLGQQAVPESELAGL